MSLNLSVVLEKRVHLKIKKKVIKKHQKENLVLKIYILEKIVEKNHQLYLNVSKLKKIDSDTYDLLIEIERGTKTKIESIKFVGNQQIKSKRLREIVASEEDKFWKIISRNTNLSENLIQLDIRLLSNYYKSLGFYDVKINSNLAEISNENTANLIYSIEEGKRYIIKNW